jgi:hypothetical protein
MKSRFARMTFLCAAILIGLPAGAANLFSFSTPDATLSPDDGYDPSVVSITADPNITAPANGTDLAAGKVGISRFWNTEWAGFSLSSANGTTLEESEFGTGYYQLTLSGASGAKLSNLGIALNSARGGGDPATQVRGFKLYAAPNGQAINFSDTPIIDVPNDTSTRTATIPYSANLSDPAFQDIDSITFRYYPLTPATGNTMDFDGWTITGTAIATPEPTSAVLVAIALTGAALKRRRRQN